MSSKLPTMHSDDEDFGTPEPTFRSSATPAHKKSQDGGHRQEENELDIFTKLLNEQMKLNKLHGAIRVYDRELLRSAIRDYDEARVAEAENDAGYEDDEDGEGGGGNGVATSRMGKAPDELKKARRLLGTIDSHDEALREACEAKDRDSILAILDNIRSSRLDRYLRGPMKDALELADALDTREIRMPILAMDKKTMCEIRSYAKPSPLVHRVMQAALLLLGEDEGTTETWSKVQTFCSPDGPKGMNRRLMTFNPDDLHQFIVERAFDLLKVIKLADVQRASPGAATFYVWAMGVLKKKGCVVDDQQTTSETTLTTGKKATKKVNIDRLIKKEIEIFAEIRSRLIERKPTKPTQKKNDSRLFYP